MSDYSRVVKIIIDGDEAVNGAEKIKSKVSELEKEIEELEKQCSACAGQMKNLDRSAADYNTRVAELSARSESYKTKMESLRRQHLTQTNALKRYRERAELTARTLDNLSGATLKELQAVRRLSAGMLSEAVPGTQKYNDVLGKHREICRQIKIVKEQMNAGMRRETSLWERIAEGFNTYAAAATTAIAAVTGITLAVRKAVQAYGDMDEEMNNVRKYTGQTKQEVVDMNDEFKKMNTRTSRIELNKLAEDAGRLGITSKQSILEFVDAADKINVALGDDLGKNAVRDIGKLAQLFGEDKRKGLRGAMLATGAAVNELAQSSSAAGEYLVDFTARVAGVGKQAGMSQADIMAYASVLDQNMQQAETSATAFSQLITKMYQDPAKFAGLAGKSVKDFANTLKNDANQALLQFFRAMKSKGGFAGVAQMFDKMGMDGTRCVAVFSTMADKLEDIEKAQNIANEAYRNGQSAINEFNVQNNSFNAQMDKAKKAFEDMAVELGQKLAPVIPYLTSSMSMMIKTLSVVVDFVLEHRRAIVMTAVAVTAYSGVLAVQTAVQKLQKMAIMDSVAALRLQITWMNLSRQAVLAWNIVTAAVTLNFTRMKAAAYLLRMELVKNPFILLATVAAAAGVAIYALATRTKELTATQSINRQVNEDMADVQKKANEAVAGTKAKIELLTAVITDNSRSIKDRRNAIAQLQKIVPGYHGSISKEGRLINHNTKAIKEYISNITKMAQAQALAEKLQESYKRQMDYDIAATNWKNGQSRLKTQRPKDAGWGSWNISGTQDWNKRMNRTQEKIDFYEGASRNETKVQQGLKKWAEKNRLDLTNQGTESSRAQFENTENEGNVPVTEKEKKGKGNKNEFPKLDRLKQEHELELIQIEVAGMKMKKTEDRINNDIYMADEKYYNKRLAIIKEYQNRTEDEEKGLKLRKDAADTEKALLETQKKSEELKLKEVQNAQENKIKAIEDSAERQKLILEKQYNEGDMAQREYENRINAVELDAAKQKLQAQIEYADRIKAVGIKNKEQETKLLEENYNRQMQAAVEFAKAEYTQKAAALAEKLDLIQTESDRTIQKYQHMYNMGMISEEKFNKMKLKARKEALKQEMKLMGLTEKEMQALAVKGGNRQIKEIQKTAKKKMRIQGASEDQINAKEKESQEIKKESEKQWVEEWMESTQNKQLSYMQTMQQMSQGLGGIIDQFATNQEMKMSEVGYRMLLMGIDQLEQIVQQELVAILAKSISTLGPIAGPIAFVALEAAVKMAFAGVKKMIHKPKAEGGGGNTASESTTGYTANRIVTKQHKEGNYNVLGKEDGRTYDNVPFVGKPLSGIVSSPALIAEQGDELIINHEDLGRLRKSVAYPIIIQAIQQARRPVQQYAAGKYTAMGKGKGMEVNEIGTAISKLNKTVEQLTNQVNNEKPIRAYVVYSELEKKKETIERMRGKFTRNNKQV